MTDATFAGVAFNPANGRLEHVTQPVPEPKGHDILVRVAAASVNPVDLKVRERLPRDGPVQRLGFDACDTVEAVGDAVAGFAPGDRVWYAGDINRHGSNGELQLVDSRLAGPAPRTVSEADAAALPLTALTAWEGLFERLGYVALSPEPQRPRLLMINGAGGVGSIALQLARASGIHVTATASRPESQEWCRQMGADDVIAHAALADQPDGAFDRIFCAAGTDGYFDEMARLVAPVGLICSITGSAEKHDLAPLFQKAAGFVWEYMFARSSHATEDMAVQGEILTRVAALIDEGRVRTTRNQTLTGFSAETVQQAHDTVAAGHNLGKLVIAY